MFEALHNFKVGDYQPSSLKGTKIEDGYLNDMALGKLMGTIRLWRKHLHLIIKLMGFSVFL
jgi:hypothetical protein